MNNAIYVSGALAVALGGLAFAFLGQNERADQRRIAIAKLPTSSSARAAVMDRTSKKKQIAESLAGFEKRSRGKRVDLQTRIEQAGWSIKKEKYLMIFAAIGVILAGLVFVKIHSGVLAGLTFITMAVGAPPFVVGWMKQRRIRKFIDALPAALDIIVRGVRAGLPLGDTLRIIASEAAEPAKSEFRKVVESQQLGISVPEACLKLAQRVPSTETNFFAIVIEIQSKAGGNLSEAVGNLSRTIRERKKMKGKISAMSMEALASAAIIGAVPFIVTGLLYAISPNYMGLLFYTVHGRYILMLALGWMSIGALMMKKMISFDF